MHGNTTMRELNILYDIDMWEYVEKKENLPVMSHINVTWNTVMLHRNLRGGTQPH